VGGWVLIGSDIKSEAKEYVRLSQFFDKEKEKEKEAV